MKLKFRLQLVSDYGKHIFLSLFLLLSINIYFKSMNSM